MFVFLLYPTEERVGRSKTGCWRRSVSTVCFATPICRFPSPQVERLLPHLGSGSHIVLGSREAPGAFRVGEPARRHLMGRVFNFLVNRLAVPGVSDTQCGFKLFRKDVAMEIFKRRQIDGFAFDVELLFIARRLGMSVAEIPVTWVNDEASRVNPIRHSTQMFVDIMRVRRLHRDL